MPDMKSIPRRNDTTNRRSCKKKPQTAATVREIQKRVYKNEIKESVSQMYDFVNAGDDQLDDICEALERVVNALDDLRKLMPREDGEYNLYKDMHTEALIEKSRRAVAELDALSRQYEEMSL